MYFLSPARPQDECALNVIALGTHTHTHTHRLLNLSLFFEAAEDASVLSLIRNLSLSRILPPLIEFVSYCYNVSSVDTLRH